jgi:hypothetical protein
MLLFASISGVLVQPPSPRVDRCATRSWKRLRGGADRRWRELRAAARPRVRTPRTLLCAPACRRTIEIRGAACFIGRHQDFRACPKALDRLAAGHSSHAGLARLPAKLSRQSGDRRGPTDTTRSNRWAACRRQALGKAVFARKRTSQKAMIDDLGSAAFMVDLASMKHETQYSDGRFGPYSCRPSASARPASILVSASRIAVAKAGWS